jgi:hypothetical protein
MKAATVECPDCGKSCHGSRGLSMHRVRSQRYGGCIYPVRRDRATEIARVLGYVDPQQGGCWYWTGARDWKGYGVTHWFGQQLMAHRVVYEFLVGPIPEGLHVDHLCSVPRCVNPDHLEPVTAQENNRRSMSRSAVNARKTACHRGHDFTPENTYVNPRGQRQCRACGAESARRRRSARR